MDGEKVWCFVCVPGQMQEPHTRAPFRVQGQGQKSQWYSASARAVEKRASVQGSASSSPWYMAISDEESFPLHQKHSTVESPWHEAVIPPSPWPDHAESQSLHRDTAEQLGQLQRKAVEEHGLQLLMANSPCQTSAQKLSRSHLQAQTLYDPANAYGAIARPHSNLNEDASSFANFGQCHPFLRDSPKEHSHTSTDLWPQRSCPSAIDFLATTRNTFHTHASLPSLLKHPLLQESRPSWEPLNSIDDGPRCSFLSKPPLPRRWSLKSWNPLRSSDDVMYATIAQMSESEIGLLWRTQKARHLLERNHRAFREEQLDIIEERRQHLEPRRGTASRLRVFEAPVDQQAHTVQCPIQAQGDPTQSLPELNNRRTRRKQRRQCFQKGTRTDSHPTTQQALSDLVPSESQSSVTTTVQPILSEAEADSMREIVRALMRDYRALGEISLTLADPGMEEWTRRNNARWRNSKSAVKNEPMNSITEDHAELYTEQRQSTPEENSTQGDPAMEEHNKQGDSTLEHHDEQRDPTQSEKGDITVPDIEDRIGHGERTLEEHNGLDLIRGDGTMESDGTVVIDHCRPVSKDGPEASSCVYEDANPFALLPLEEPFTQPGSEDEPVTTLYDPPTPMTMPPTPEKTPLKQARKRCSNARRASRKRCSLSVESSLPTKPTMPSTSPATPSEPSPTTLMSRSATLLDLQLLQESMVVSPPSESTLKCAKILKATPPSILAARTRMQLYRDSDNHKAAFLGYDVCDVLQSGPCCMSQWNCDRWRFAFPGEGQDHFEMPVLPYDHSERTHQHYVFVVMPVTSEGLDPSDKRIRMPEPGPRLEEESDTYTREQEFLERYGHQMVDTVYFGMTCQKISECYAEDIERALRTTTADLLGSAHDMSRDECLALAREMLRLAGYPVREAWE